MASNETPDGLTPKASRTPRETHEPERKCILSGEHDARDDLIRLAISPDGMVLPDVRAKAPGRGAWLGVDRPTLEAAMAKGKLRGALARAFKGKPLTVPDNLGEMIETALERAFLDRLGLESRSGMLLIGSDRIAEAARKGRVHLLMHASDASEDGSRKLDQALRVGSDAEGSGLRGLDLPVSRTILAMALGRENVVHVALVDRAAARRVGDALARWRGFIGRDGEAEPRDSSRGRSASATLNEAGLPADGDDDGGDAALDDVGI
ncbi:DUF448 domain-containing protein [Sphingomonas sp. PR090111-T3T-6A]|uniref:DUF448 domain-containing protein n=1 Tax=Sphingomonas sp. PR090111-T3T-6A TaxID=685778 RepID=UPI000360F403|nr:DUF448 domain-containing protein [Sphingomonas sp. PR090111-T3T-6A]